MLNTDPQNLYTEIQAAEKFRDEHMSSYERRRSRYVGPSYIGEEIQGYEPENHEFEYISLLLPKTVFDNPRVRVQAFRPGPIQDIAMGIQAGMNRWIRDTRLRRTLVRIGLDNFMAWGIAVIHMEPDKDRLPPPWSNIALPYRPVVERISPKRVFWDPTALDFHECRFIGHIWARDKDDLLKMAKEHPEDGWDRESIESCSEDGGIDKLDRDTKYGTPTRKEIVCYEVYVPGYQLEGEPSQEEGFNGAIFTLAVAGSGMDKKGVSIRKPRMYYGPPEGPYTLFGTYPVPDTTVPLSPTVAIQAQVETLNTHAKAVMKAAAQRKRIAFVSRAEPDLQKKVKRAEDGDVVPINTEELNNNLKEVELGGVTNSAIQALQIERERRDRISGMSDAMRGNVAGSGTATENAIAAESATARMAFIKQQFTDSVSDVLRKVAWYMYHDDRIVFPIGDEIAAQLGVEPGTLYMEKGEPWYQGGVPEDMTGYSFKDLDLDIEPYSMERVSEQQQQARMMQLVQIVTQIIPQAISAPVDLQALLNVIGNMTNTPDIAKVVDINAAKAMQQQMLQGMVTKQSEQPAKTASDVGQKNKAPGLVQPGGSPPNSTVTPMASMSGGTVPQQMGMQPMPLP